MLRIGLMMLELGISRRDLAATTKWTKNQITAAFTHERLPLREHNREAFIRFFNEYCSSRPDCMSWLASKGLTIESLWESIGDQPGVIASAIGAAISTKKKQGPPIVPGDPLEIDEKEEPMLTQRAMKHFRLFRNPFVGDVRQVKDIYMGEEHVFLREMMFEVAKHAGFCAIVGEVGSGKSIMRKAVVTKLMQDGVKVIYPRIIDKSRISPVSLIDAIIMDISDETPRRSLEAKTRQAERLLRSHAERTTQVLIIEEAHQLSNSAIKCLKQIYELEDDFRKLIGIILIGQTELKHLLDEARHPELREVIRRITIAEITDLGKQDIGPYLKHKFAPLGSGKYEEIFAPDAVDALLQRLPQKAYPLSVNNLVARAMNLAAEMGEAKVTAEVVLAS